MCVAGLTRMEYQYGVPLLSTWWIKNGYGQWLISSCLCLHFPVIWCSWLGDRKSIQSVKKAHTSYALRFTFGTHGTRSSMGNWQNQFHLESIH